MSRTRRYAGRGAVGALALLALAFGLSAVWVDWPSVSEDTHGATIVFGLALMPVVALVGAGVGAFASVLSHLNEQS